MWAAVLSTRGDTLPGHNPDSVVSPRRHRTFGGNVLSFMAERGVDPSAAHNLPLAGPRSPPVGSPAPWHIFPRKVYPISLICATSAPNLKGPLAAVPSPTSPPLNIIQSINISTNQYIDDIRMSQQISLDNHQVNACTFDLSKNL